MKVLLRTIGGIGAVLFLSGFDNEAVQREQARQSEDIRRIQEQIGQVANDTRAMQAENEALKAEVARLKTGLAADQEVRKELERLDGLIRKVDAAREQDRKVIIEEVARALGQIKQPAVIPTPPKNKSVKSAKNPVEEGYEHVVKKGEYLAAIAEAYGVTVKAIKDANQLKTNELKSGQKLFIPKK